MQVSDIFTLGINLTHSGTDQRKIHVIAREVALKLQIQNLKDINGEIIKPIAIHHNLLLGLQSPKIWPLPEGEEKESMRTQMKMSKSIPNSAIFIHDSEEEIREKIKQAFCPAQEIEFNPIIDWATNLILPLKGKLVIKRPEKFGGNITFNSKEDLDKTFAKGELHPMDLKNSIADTLVEILRPAREKFADQKSKNLIKQIKNIDEFTT
jgi:tyrosyl-tRNA synthetase